MRTHVTISIWILGVSSVIAAIVGIATIVSAYTYTYDHVDRATAVMSESLEDIEQVVDVLNDHESDLREFEDVPSQIEATIRDLPPLTEAGSEALAATIDTLDKTASLVESIDGRGDLILSGSPLKAHAAALRENSKRLRELHEKMDEAQGTLELTVKESTGALHAARSIGKELRGPVPSLGEVEDRLHEVRGMSDSGMLAAGAAGVQAMIGGLYFLIGLLLGGLATLVAQLDRRQFHSHEYSE